MSSMKQGKTVFTGQSKQNKIITIRYVEDTDAEALCQYINILSQERTFMRFQGEQVTLEDEIAYVTQQVELIQQKRAVRLLALCDTTIIGSAGITMKNMIERHVGVFGISIAQGYRGEGIGRLLMDAVLKEAEEHIPELRIVVLDVFSDNAPAIAMYEKSGFVVYGRLPMGFLHGDVFVDNVRMYKNVQR